LILFILKPKLRERKERKQFVMSESTKVTKKRKRESTIIHGRPQKFFQGGNVDILYIVFKMLTFGVPYKLISH